MTVHRDVSLLDGDDDDDDDETRQMGRKTKKHRRGLEPRNISCVVRPPVVGNHWLPFLYWK